MTTTTRSTVVGVFHDRSHANQAIEDLKRAGFREDQIGLVAHDDRGTGDAADAARGSHAGTGAVTGAVAGAGVGALWALGIMAGLLPGIGPVVAGGILGSILLSAAGTAVAGGIVGALVGLGIPEEEARYYEGEFKSGRVLVTVKAESRYDEAQAILRRHGAYDMHSAGTATAAPAARTGTFTGATATATGAQSVQLREEQLHATKQPVKTGEVHVRKEVVTEQKSIDVPVKREEVVIERHPVAGNPPASGDIRPGEEVRIPVTEEQVRVEKTPVVKEEVTVGKRQVQDTEHVAGTVRKEEVRVEEKGDVNVRNAGTTKNPPRK